MSISELIGIPYALGYSSAEQGCDCWGLVKLAFLRERGIVLPPYNAELAGRKVPPRGFVAEAAGGEQARAWMPVLHEEALPFDVVLLRNLRPADHVAIVSEDPVLLLTTDRGLGSHLCEWGPRSHWGSENRIEGIFRFVGA